MTGFRLVHVCGSTTVAHITFQGVCRVEDLNEANRCWPHRSPRRITLKSHNPNSAVLFMADAAVDLAACAPSPPPPPPPLPPTPHAPILSHPAVTKNYALFATALLTGLRKYTSARSASPSIWKLPHPSLSVCLSVCLSGWLSLSLSFSVCLSLCAFSLCG